MIEMFKAIKHCYHEIGTCKDCPYEHDQEKCENLFNNIETAFTKIGEFIEFDDQYQTLNEPNQNKRNNL